MSVCAGRREDSITRSLLLSEYTATAFRYISLSYRFRRTFCQNKISWYADIEVKMKGFRVFTSNMQISVYTIRNQITTLLTRRRRSFVSFVNKIIPLKWFYSISVQFLPQVLKIQYHWSVGHRRSVFYRRSVVYRRSIVYRRSVVYRRSIVYRRSVVYRRSIVYRLSVVYRRSIVYRRSVAHRQSVALSTLSYFPSIMFL